MKKCVQYFAIIFTIILLFCSFATTAFAKDLEPCYHCSGTGEFHCHICDNNGETVCDTCGGAGKWACPGEEGKGKCNNGWIVCPSCNGDGKIRSGDGKIGDGPCGNCADSGKPGYIRCVVCHGSGEVICPGCSGNGKCECQVGDCQKARTVGYKCPYCMGAGYLLVNFSPGENNGVDNRPANGDQIWVNGKHTVYGGSSGGNNSQSENNQSSDGKQTETSPPASSDTKPQTGTQTTNSKPSINETPSSEITVQLPGNRTSDFTLAPNQDGDKTTNTSAAVEIAQMSASELAYYTSLSDEELGSKLTKVQQIVSTVSPGRFEEGYEDALNKIAEQNGFSSLEEGRIFPIYFEGHEDVGFPVKVTVKLEKGVMDGGSDLFIYHISENGSIEELGKAEFSTFEDGSIETISFFTTGFSSFFTAKKQLDIAVAEQIFAGAAAVTDINTGNNNNESNSHNNNNNESNSHNIYILVAIIAVAVIVIAVLSVVFIKKRKSNV